MSGTCLALLCHRTRLDLVGPPSPLLSSPKAEPTQLLWFQAEGIDQVAVQNPEEIWNITNSIKPRWFVKDCGVVPKQDALNHPEMSLQTFSMFSLYAFNILRVKLGFNSSLAWRQHWGKALSAKWLLFGLLCSVPQFRIWRSWPSEAQVLKCKHCHIGTVHEQPAISSAWFCFIDIWPIGNDEERLCDSEQRELKYPKTRIYLTGNKHCDRLEV